MAVYLFFALSGYWVVKMWQSKYSKLTNPYSTFIFSRIWRLGPIFFLCSLSAIAIVVWLPEAIHAQQHPMQLTVPMWLSSLFLLGFHSTQRQGPLGPAWSLDIELQFYIIAPVIIIFLQKKPKATVVALLILSLFSWCLVGDAVVPVYFPMFLTGMLTAFYPNHIKNQNIATGSCIATLILILLFISNKTLRQVLFGGSHPDNLFIFNKPLNIAIAVLALPFALNTVFQKSNTRDRLFSDMSYSVYLIHYLPIIAITYLYPSTLTQNKIQRVELTACILAAVYTLSYTVTKFIDRPISRFRSAYIERRDSQK